MRRPLPEHRFKMGHGCHPGFGAVGAFSAKFIRGERARYVPSPPSKGRSTTPGLDVEKLLELKEKHGDKAVLRYGRPERSPWERAGDPGGCADSRGQGGSITEKNMRNMKPR